MQWFWNSVTAWVADWIGYLLNPVAWLEAGLNMLGWLMETVAMFLPEEASGIMIDWASYLAGLEFQALSGAVLFLFSPVVNPDILLACIAIGIYVWVASLAVKVVMFLLTKLYAGGN